MLGREVPLHCPHQRRSVVDRDYGKRGMWFFLAAQYCSGPRRGHRDGRRSLNPGWWYSCPSTHWVEALGSRGTRTLTAFNSSNQHSVPGRSKEQTSEDKDLLQPSLHRLGRQLSLLPLLRLGQVFLPTCLRTEHLVSWASDRDLWWVYMLTCGEVYDRFGNNIWIV